MPIDVKLVNLVKDLPLPEYKTELSSGMDLYSAEDDFYLYAKGMGIINTHWKCVNTGIKVAVPEGYEIQIRPRSGLALKQCITVVNTPGTIDADYRGPVGVILINHGTTSFLIKKGERIAQMVLCPVAKMNLVEVEELDNTARGEGGFGSTGV